MAIGGKVRSAKLIPQPLNVPLYQVAYVHTFKKAGYLPSTNNSFLQELGKGICKTKPIGDIGREEMRALKEQTRLHGPEFNKGDKKRRALFQPQKVRKQQALGSIKYFELVFKVFEILSLLFISFLKYFSDLRTNPFQEEEDDARKLSHKDKILRWFGLASKLESNV